MAEDDTGMQHGEERDMDFEPTRGLRYCELFAVGPEWITVYNSIGLSEAPPELWDALDAEDSARQLGVETVIKNGPHWWMADKATIRFNVEQVTVGGIGFRTVARLPAFLAKSGKLEPPFYSVNVAQKQGVNVYSAGALVYELVTPDGDPLVLQSTNVPPDELASLGDRLKPAEGWQFRTRTLDEDLTMVMAGKVNVAMDELHNVYNMQSSAEPEAEEPGEAKDLDVLIAVYPGPDSAGKDFEGFLALVEAGKIRTDGAVLVTRDENGEVQVRETGDHAGRKGAKVGGGLGLVVGLFSPPLLAATVVGAAGGALVGKFAKKRVAHGIGEKMDDALPEGAAGIIAIYDHEHAADVDGALANALTKSVAGIDHASAKELKAGLTEAQGGLGV